MFLLISSMLENFPKDQRYIIMSSIKCLNFKFLQSKIMHKNKFMDRIVNNIWLAQNLTCVLKTKRTCNPTIRFLKSVVMLIFLWEVYPNFCPCLYAHNCTWTQDTSLLLSCYFTISLISSSFPYTLWCILLLENDDVIGEFYTLLGMWMFWTSVGLNINFQSCSEFIASSIHLGNHISLDLYGFSVEC